MVDPGPPGTLDTNALIALGAIIATPPNADPQEWVELARQHGGKPLTAEELDAVRNRMLRVRDRLEHANATVEQENVVFRLDKMMPNPRPRFGERVESPKDD